MFALMLLAFVSIIIMLILFDYSGKQLIAMLIVAAVCSMTSISFYLEMVKRNKSGKI
jgi:hypothetical protein